ncbi:MAG: hypothetical protein ABL961_10320 [Vicinamibacterales bacterium]
MVTRRRAFALGSAGIVFLSAALLAQQTPAPRKLSNAEKKETQAVLKLVEDFNAGKPAKNELALAWMNRDLLKAQSNKTYVPFTVTIDPTKVSGGKVSLYWRVTSKDASPAPVADGKKDDKKEVPKKAEYAYEDLNTVTVDPAAGSPMRISRSFTVAPGNYDVVVVAKELTPEKPKKGEPEPKISLIKQDVEVADFWNGELTTSTVLVAERIDPLPAALTPQQQGERPYALGTIEISPASSTKFKKNAELSTFLLIYNAKTDSSNKPDLLVEYSFYAKQAGGEKFFNKTSPQNLNAQTLPPQFDFAAGHQLQSGQAVPLASFPEGDYRLEITVTDNLDGKKKLTRDVNFSVAGS